MTKTDQIDIDVSNAPEPHTGSYSGLKKVLIVFGAAIAFWGALGFIAFH